MINRQFYIYKFESKILDREKYKINITFKNAKENNQIIAVADSQMLRSIRDIQSRYIDREKLELLFQKREEFKKLQSSKTNSSLIKDINKQINNMMFVPEYVTVIINNNKHYEKLFKNGLFINGEKYVRFSCSASQARVNTIVMVQENISKELYERLNNGRHDKKLNPSKFNAYFGLSSSATIPVSTPRVCVVKDCLLKRDTFVNFVTEIDEPLKDDIIEQKNVEIEYNYFDGMGLISPEQSKKWATELGLDYTPAEWCIRNAWIKGMVCTFPIHEFCEKVNGGNYLVETFYNDENGNPIKQDLREVDIIISESQFKMASCYDSYSEYEYNCEKNKLNWGISRYTPKIDKNCLFLNYQSIQTLKLSKDDIVKLCQPTVGWIEDVNGEDVMKTILFMMGKSASPNNIKNFLQSSDNYWLKSLIVNNEVIKDKYSCDKIYDNIVNKIKSACMGKLIVEGNYQVIVSDPFAMMQHVCGIYPSGLLGEREYYSKYWNDKGVSIVDSMRSPLTYRSEHNILNLKNNDELNHWYRYLNTGIVLNVHSDDVLRFADSDFDMDILASTSNQTIINGVYKDEYAVTYNKKMTPKIDFTEEDLYNADICAFGSEIGSITNKSTSMYAMLPLYNKNSEQYKEIEKRLIMTRVAQGNAIDKAKGIKTKQFPKHWSNYQRDDSNDSSDMAQKKKLFNSILIEKKPYFFRYLYKDSKSSYNKFIKQEEDYRKACGLNLDCILSKRDNERTKEEKEYLFMMDFRNPLIESDCEMNMVCKHIENVNFNLKRKKSDIKYNYSIYSNDKIDWNYENYLKVKNTVKSYFKEMREDIILGGYYQSSKYDDDEYKKINTKYDIFKEKVNDACSNIDEATNYLVKIFYNDFPSYDKNILWKCFGKYMYQNVFSKSNGNIFVPNITDHGDKEYMFDKYNVAEVDLIG